MLKVRVYVDYLILFFIFTGIVSTLSEFLMTPRTISGLALYFLFFSKYLVLKCNFDAKVNKKLLILYLLFFFSLFVSAILSENPFYSFHWIKKSYWVSIAITLGVISIGFDERLFKTLMYAMLVTLFLNNLHFYFKSVKAYHTYNLFASGFFIDRNYSTLLEILLPFGFFGIFYFGNNLLKVFTLLNTLAGIVLLILCGTPQGSTVRGAYISVFCEFLIFVFLLNYLPKYKVWAKRLLILFLAGSVSVFFAFKNHRVIQNALKKGLSSSGRVTIIKDRLPLFIKYKPIFGIGYGRKLYFDFLDKHHAPKRIGCYDKKEHRFIYFGDEGLFIQTFIRQGIFGLIIFLILYGYTVKLSFSLGKSANNQRLKVIYFTIFTILIGHFLVRGLVETLSLTSYFILISFLLPQPKACEK